MAQLEHSSDLQRSALFCLCDQHGSWWHFLSCFLIWCSFRSFVLMDYALQIKHLTWHWEWTLSFSLCAVTSGVNWTVLGLRHCWEKIPLEDLLVWHTTPLSSIAKRPWLHHHRGLHGNSTAHRLHSGLKLIQLWFPEPAGFCSEIQKGYNNRLDYNQNWLGLL